MGVDALKEFQKLLVTMPSMTLPNHFAARDVQRREQRGRAMADIVVGLARRDARTHRQERPRAVQRLHLALFVHRQHDGAIRRKEIQSDNVAHLFDELRVRRQLERVEAMRLQPKRLPDAPDRRL